MVSAAFPSPLGSVGKKEEVVHFELHNHVSEVTNGGAFMKRVGKVVNYMTSWQHVVSIMSI